MMNTSLTNMSQSIKTVNSMIGLKNTFKSINDGNFSSTNRVSANSKKESSIISSSLKQTKRSSVTLTTNQSFSNSLAGHQNSVKQP